jgi:hypothetical protein
MFLFSRSLRRSVCCLLSILPGVCAAQIQQFPNLPVVYPTSGRVSSFLTGLFQNPPGGTDMLYINAPLVSAGSSSVTAGILLNSSGGGFLNPGQDRITFTGVSNVVAALDDFTGDGKTDFAFALSPSGSSTNYLCVYYGTGVTYTQAAAFVTNSNYYPGNPAANTYPPTSGENGCMTFHLVPGSRTPYFSAIAAFPFKVNVPQQQLMMEDSANNVLYIFKGNGATGTNGVLTGFTLMTTIQLPAADGAGPIYLGDFNGDGFTDFIVNGQTGNTASVYYGDGTGNFSAPVYATSVPVHSMLLQDMNHDGIQDLVVEGDQGVIEIFPGTGTTANPFSATSIGGTPNGVNGFSGNGGHLAAIDPNTLNILTTTPIGLSVLEGNGSLSYALKGIYNIGPGRSSFALASFYGTVAPDLAVDSAEGVAVFDADANGDGGFQTSNAYAALAPALGSVVGKFRTVNNPNGYLDAVVNTGAAQAQLLTGMGSGVFGTFANPTNPGNLPAGGIPANLWSNLVSADFNGDGIPDLAYSLTGFPSPTPGSGAGPGLYVQYGVGDGTFAAPVAVSPSLVGAPAANTFYGESVVGDFNGDGIADIANIDASYDDTLLGLSTKSFNLGLNATVSNTVASQVAAGFFKLNRTAQQDLIFQQGTSLIPYKNAQDGTGKNFTAMPALTGASSPFYPATVLLADVDGDGNADVVAVYYNFALNQANSNPVAPNQAYIWWGNGDGTFSAAPQVLSLSRNDYLAAVADMNGDGLPDLVLSDGSLITILYNQGSAGTPVNRTFGGEQHYLAGQGINSISVADLTGRGELDLIVANGGVTISNPIALGGTTASSLSLTPNPDVNTGGITVLMNAITTQPVTVTLVATPQPSTYAATFTLTATVTPSAGVALPTGKVQFTFAGNNLGSPVTLVPGATSSTASYTIPAGNTYAAGIYPMTAIYSGDSANSPATISGTHQIQGSGTTTVLYLCAGPTAACPATGYVMPPFTSAFSMYYGQDWNGTVVVTALDGGALPGTVSIYDAYTGAAPPPPSPLCTLPTGTGGTCPASVGTTVGTSVGTNVITATYSGDSTHTGSTTMPGVTITVLQDTNTGSLSGAPNPSPLGQPVTFTATFTGNYAAPTGTVQFVELFPPTTSAVVLGSATLVPGPGLSSTATFTTTALPLGTDSIQADYAATTDFAAANSPVITETVTPSVAGSFTLAVVPSPLSIGVGLGAQLDVTVTPQNGFSQSVNLACSNLPYEATCIFVNPTIAGGGGSTTLIVETTAPHSCGASTPYFYGAGGRGPLAAPFALPALAGLLLLIVPGKRRWLRALVVVAAVAAATQITGCSTCTDLGTRPGTYSFQVTGTAATSSEVQAQTVTITVAI